MKISERIFEIMKQKKLRASDLANYLQISPSTISDWKTKGNTPSADLIYKIAKFLDVTTDYLLTGEEVSMDINSFSSEGEWALLKADFLLSGLKDFLKRLDGEDAKKIMQTCVYFFDYFYEVNCYNDAQSKKEYLEHAYRLSKNLMLCLSEVNSMCISTSKKDYKAMMKYKDKMNQHIANTEKELKMILNQRIAYNNFDMSV